MVEHAIHPARQIERYILVGTTVVHALPVLILQLKRMSAEIHLIETFSRSGKHLVRLTLKRDRRPFLMPLFHAIRQRKGIIARRREMIISTQPDFFLIIRIESNVKGLLRNRKQVTPIIQHGFTQINQCTATTFGIIDAPFTVVLTNRQRLLTDIRCQPEHFGTVGHFRFSETGKQTEDIMGIIADDKGGLLTGHSFIRRHVIRQLLFLERNGHANIAVFLIDGSGPACLPKRFVRLQLRIEIEEVEQMIIRLFHESYIFYYLFLKYPYSGSKPAADLISSGTIGPLFVHTFIGPGRLESKRTSGHQLFSTR